MSAAPALPALAAPPALGPRVDSLDLLRGVAILGIFLMNTQSMILPSGSYWNPDVHLLDGNESARGNFHGANVAAYLFTNLFADMKFITIFSFMFGAGILLQGERVASRGVSPAVIHYRRMIILLVIALAHAYVIWYGDILTEYALCGLLLFPLRRMVPQLLFALGVCAVIAGGLFILAKYSYATLDNYRYVDRPDDATYALGAAHPGDISKTFPLNYVDWISSRIDAQFTDNEHEAFTGQAVIPHDDGPDTIETVYWKDEIKFRTLCSLLSQFQEFPKWSFWRCGGCMLVGMALLRWKFFHGTWGKPAYWAIALIGIPVGLAITGMGIAFNTYIFHWDELPLRKFGMLFNYTGSFLQAFAYMSVGVLVAMRIAEPATGWTQLPVKLLHYAVIPIRSVGKMALSNYLFQSVVGTTIAYGHRISDHTAFGFAQYGKLERYQLLYIVPCVWATQLIFSTIWLRFFRQGPVEALWHKLAYFGHSYPLRPAESVTPDTLSPSPV